MPDSHEILAGLGRIAEEAFPLAVVWHVVVALALVALARGWRPSRRLAAGLLCLPLLSVGALAFGFGNPFNGGVFVLLAGVLAVLGGRGPVDAVRPGGAVARAFGIGMIAFAWVYPHFLAGWSPLAYAIGAPMGLVPCPTLSVAIGLALLDGRIGGRAWTFILGAAGVAYALIGTIRLGVTIDLALLAGAAGLLVVAVRGSRSEAAQVLPAA